MIFARAGVLDLNSGHKKEGDPGQHSVRRVSGDLRCIPSSGTLFLRSRKQI